MIILVLKSIHDTSIKYLEEIHSFNIDSKNSTLTQNVDMALKIPPLITKNI